MCVSCLTHIGKKICNLLCGEGGRTIDENMGMEGFAFVTLFITHTPVNCTGKLGENLSHLIMSESVVSRIIDGQLKFAATPLSGHKAPFFIAVHQVYAKLLFAKGNTSPLQT